MHLQKTLLSGMIAGILATGSALAETALKLDFEPGNQPQSSSAKSMDAARWFGGQATWLDNSALRASGKHALVADSAAATLVFAEPMMNVEFFFVHGDQIRPGTARAFSADGRLIGSVSSRKATHFGDSRNFVSFKSKDPVFMIEFDGGAIDALQADAFQIDYPLVQGQWVQVVEGEDNRQGITFDFIETSNLLFAAWYTYGTDAAEPAFETVGAADNRWLTGQLDIGSNSNTASGPLFATSGGAFAQTATGAEASVQAGDLSVTFIDCDRAIVDYQLADGGPAGQFEIIPLEKRVNPSEFSCDPEASRPTVFQPDVSRTDSNINVLVRAARDLDRLALQFSWRTNKNYPGVLHDLRQLGENGEWGAPIANISRDSATRVNEDRVAVIFETETSDFVLSEQTKSFGCFMSCHEDLPDMPENTGVASHYVINGRVDPGTYQADMWHWRGSRSGPMGFAEDTWISAELREDPDSEGRQRDANSVGPDGNRLRLRENQGFGSEFDVVVNGQARTVKLPTFVYDPALNSGFYFLNDGTRLITEARIGDLWAFNTIERMEAGELQHALINFGPRANAVRVADLDAEELNKVAAQALAGGLINRPFLNDDYTGDSDQHHVRSNRSFENGVWTVTLIRDLNTGSPNDIDLSAIGEREFTFGVAVHDSNNGGRTHNISVPLTLGGDVEPVAVDAIEDVDWLSIPAFSTVLFKPGDMSFEWLQDKENGHRNQIVTRCSTCHGQGGVAARAPLNLQD
ncbi:MAG: ethylbenzene dehydrogenase-related protein [Wenzhouxiangellaceae bacterium]|nr:ethylbenzene dehydrogenase-related protein [Wenzhouxiangellaceae bacterium]